MSKKQQKKTAARPPEVIGSKILSTFRRVCPQNVLPSEECITLLLTSGGDRSSDWCDLVESFGPASVQEQEHSDQLQLERDSQAEELASVESRIAHLEKDIHQVERDIAQQATGGEPHSMEHENLQKEALLSAFSHVLSDSSLLLSDVCSELESCTRLPNTGDMSYFQRTDLLATEHAVLLESSCTRSLRTTCAAVAEAQYGHGELHEKNLKLQEAASQLKVVLESYPPDEILASLKECSTLGTQKLKHLMDSTDLSREARELSLTLEESQWTDLASSGSLLDSLRHHIQEIHLEQACRVAALESTNQKANTLKKKVTDLQTQANNRLMAKYGSYSEAYQVASAVLSLETGEAGHTAAAEYLTSKANDLDNALHEWQDRALSLVEKRDRIRDFAVVSESKQGSVDQLVKHKAHLQEQVVPKQREKIIQFRRQHICTCELSIATLANSLKNTALLEMKAFVSVDLSRLSFSLQKPLSRSQPLLSDLMGVEQWCPAQGPERLLPAIVTMLHQVDALQKELNLTTRAADAALYRGADVQELVGKVETAKSEESRSTVAIIGLVHSAKSLLESGDGVISDIKDWWSCPVQSTVPWVTREGMSFEEWRKQWDLLASKLRASRSAVQDRTL